MIKGTVYPKTTRIGNQNKVTVTEKVDGSNLCFFKLDGELYIAQRNNIYTFAEVHDVKEIVYSGLYGWLGDYGGYLKDSLHEGSAICGEWVGMGHIKYGETFDTRFLMFAKANIDEETMKLKNIVYKHDLFIYPFIEQEIPEYIGKVNIVREFNGELSIPELDILFDETEEEYGRMIEGFIVYNHSSNTILKYVRRKGKGGKLQDHIPGK